MMRVKLTVLFCGLLMIAGCRCDQEKKITQAEPSEPTKIAIQVQNCSSCHPDVSLDPNHDFPCVQCHKGNELGKNKKSAHEGLVGRPAHPDFMVESCGGCHSEVVQNSQTSLHFTLRNEVNRVREHFGIQEKVSSLTEISPFSQPTTPTELADDMLRRRCLRCHIFSRGDSYANTRRGTGCAACHMEFSGGSLQSHTFRKIPSDTQCLSCHYANFVGADYYGRYEHDFGDEYRTPFTTREEFFRPYGVEYHELVPDIHQQRGLSCVDCHSGHQPSQEAGEKKITCRTCHQLGSGVLDTDALPANIRIDNNTPILMARLTGKEHPVPQMTHPAHEKYSEKVSCQVCHAQWSFNDSTTHLLRNDTDDYETLLSIQSSSTVENPPEQNFSGDTDELLPSMPDTVTGRLFPGVWYKGFTQRRWEDMLIRQDQDGIIKVFRPILDLRLSYVDRDENIVFDNLQGYGQALLPYTPHTTGKAGMFYLNRFTQLLNQENTKSTDQ